MTYLKFRTQFVIILLLFSQICLAELTGGPITETMVDAAEQASAKRRFRMQITNTDKCASVIKNMRKQELRLGAESSIAVSSLGIYYASQKRLGAKLLALSKEIDVINIKQDTYYSVEAIKNMANSTQLYGAGTQSLNKYHKLRDAMRIISNRIDDVIAQAYENGLYNIESIAAELEVLKNTKTELAKSITELTKYIVNRGVAYGTQPWAALAQRFSAVTAQLAKVGTAISGGSLARLSIRKGQAKAAQYALKGIGFVGKRLIPVAGFAASAYDVGGLAGWVSDKAIEFRVSKYPGAEYLSDYSIYDPRVDANLICEKVMNIPNGPDVLEDKANTLFNGTAAGYELYREGANSPTQDVANNVREQKSGQ
jgi:hypothetical protein